MLEVPVGVDTRDGPVATFCELRDGGKVVGELAISVFPAALIIARDGILAEKARDTARRELGGGPAGDAVAVRLPGATGYRADGVRGAQLPYVYAFTFAPSDLGVDGGVLVVMRAATPDWPAGERMLGSLRLLRRNGTVEEPGDADEAELLLPIVARG